MFIEKLSYEDEVRLVKKFAKYIDKNCIVDDFFNVQHYIGFDNMCFSVNGSPCSCRFQDFKVTLSYGTTEQQEQLTNIYREHMYNLFYQKYLDGIRDYYTKNENQQKLAEMSK